MKIILFSDIHVHKFNAFASVINGTHSRVYYALDVMRQIFEYAKKNSIKDIFFGGDMFDTKSILQTEVYDETYEFFDSYKDELNLYFIPGNHDMARKGKYHSLKPLKGVGKVFSEPTTLDFDGYKIAMVPFMHFREDVFAAIKGTPGNLLIAHEGIIGARVEGREIIEDGKSKKAGIHPKEALMGGHQQVFLGHFHDPFCLDHPQIQFIGAPIHTDFGDITDRGFWVYDTDTNEKTFVKTTFPRFITLTDKSLKDYSEEELDNLCQNNYVRMLLSKKSKKAESVQKKNVVQVRVEPKERTYENRLNVKSFDDVKSIAEAYVDKYHKEYNLDRQELIELASNIVEQTAVDTDNESFMIGNESNIELINLKVENFLPYKDVTFTLNDRGLTLIKGENVESPYSTSNGSGKTSLLDALTFSLFGETIRKIPVASLVNNKIKKDCRVAISFRILENVYQITRHRAHSKYGNDVSLTINGQPYDGDDNKNTQKEINRILGMDFNLFLNSFLFGQGVTKFFADLTDKDQKAILENILNTSRFATYLDTVRELKKQKKAEVDSVQSQINRLVAKIENSNDTLESLKIQHGNFEREKERRIEECHINLREFDNSKEPQEIKQLLAIADSKLNELKSQLPFSKIDYNLKMEEYKKIQESLQDTTMKLTTANTLRINKLNSPEMQYSYPEISEVEKSIVDINNSVTLLMSKTKELQDKQSNVEERLRQSEDKKLVLMTTIGQLKKQLEDLNSVGAVCPTCNQKASQLHLSHTSAKFSKKHQDTMGELEENNKLIGQLKTELVEIKSMVQATEESYQEANTNLQNLAEIREGISRKGILEAEIAKHNEEVEKYNLDAEMHRFQVDKIIAETSKYDEVNNMIAQFESSYNIIVEKDKFYSSRRDDLVSGLKVVESEVSPYKHPMQLQIEAIESNQNKIQECQDQLSGFSSQFDCLLFWETGFGQRGIRSLILDSVVPILDEKANEYAKILTDGAVNIKFNTQEYVKSKKTYKDSFNVAVTNQFGSDNYKGNSGGEKRRIDICILLALQNLAQMRAKNSLNVLFFDEVFESVDAEGRHAIIDLLNHLASKIPSIFVITHHAELASSFDNSVTIKKAGGFANIEED